MRHKNYVLTLAVAILVSCTSTVQHEQSEDRARLETQIDSLRATGEHGYFVATYLVGRYKTSRVLTAPCTVTVLRLDPDLADTPIGLQFMEGNAYELTIPRNGGSIVVPGEFDALLSNKRIELMLTDGPTASAQKQLQNMQFELRILPY